MQIQKQNPKKICAEKGEPEFHRLALAWDKKVRHRPDNVNLQNMPLTSCY